MRDIGSRTHHVCWLILCVYAPAIRSCLLLFVCVYHVCYTNKLSIIGQKAQLEVGRFCVHIVSNAWCNMDHAAALPNVAHKLENLERSVQRVQHED